MCRSSSPGSRPQSIYVLFCSNHSKSCNRVKNVVLLPDVGRLKLSGTCSMPVVNICPSISLLNSAVESLRIVVYVSLSLSSPTTHFILSFSLSTHNFEKVLSGGRCYLHLSRSPALASVCLQHRLPCALAIFSSSLSESSATKTDHERGHGCSLLKL